MEKIRAKGLGLIAISYDSTAVLSYFTKRQGISYPLLSDIGSQVIRRYGLLNETVAPNTAEFGIPYPGTYVLNPSGVVVAKYFVEETHRQRYTVPQILVRQYGGEAATQRSEARTKHLTVTSSASQAEARPGQKIALELDIRLKRGMHVYAPGAQGYIPIEFKIQDTAVAHPAGAAYPPAKTLYLAAIKESAPVFEGRLRLVQDIAFGLHEEVKPLVKPDSTVVVEGSLRYQACDAKQCYLPQSVPLRWTFKYSDLERERVPRELQREAPGK